jgi:uncharacterized protein (TIGR02118 family)
VSHWLGPHAQIATQLPGLRGYVVNAIEEREEVGWDGIAETWFDSREDAIRAFASEPMLTMLAEDRPKFLEEVKVIFVEEHIVMPPIIWSGQQDRPTS